MIQWLKWNSDEINWWSCFFLLKCIQKSLWWLCVFYHCLHRYEHAHSISKPHDDCVARFYMKNWKPWAFLSRSFQTQSSISKQEFRSERGKFLWHAHLVVCVHTYNCFWISQYITLQQGIPSVSIEYFPPPVLLNVVQCLKKLPDLVDYPKLVNIYVESGS